DGHGRDRRDAVGAPAATAVHRHRNPGRLHHLLHLRHRHPAPGRHRPRRDRTGRPGPDHRRGACGDLGHRRTHPPRDHQEATMTRLTGTALRLTVFIGESDTWHHKPLFTEIVHRAHHAGRAGASVFRGIEGYGASSRIHTTRLLSLSEDLPVAIVVIDAAEKIRAFLPQLDELVAEGLVILDEVEVIRYVGRP